MSTCCIEILTFDGCPNEQLARERVDAALGKLALSAQVVITRIETPELAQEMRFLGSPSVRVCGEDVEPGARERTDFGLMCRTYSAGTDVAPPVEDIAAAIRRWCVGRRG